MTQISGMTEPEDPKKSDTDTATDAPKPADELKAAFDHLKNAAGLLVGRIQKDESLRKAAHDAEAALEKAATGVEHAAETAAAEAEKAVKQLGERAQPIVKDIGSELSRLAKTVRTVLEPEPIPGEGAEPRPGSSTGDPNEVQRSESGDEKKGEAEAKGDEEK